MMRPIVYNVPAPTAPTGLAGTVTFNALTASVNLTWTSNGSASTYTVQRATNTGFTAGLSSFTVDGASSFVSGSSYGWTDSPVSQNTRYYYRVRGDNPAGTSAWSNVLTIVTIPSPTNLAAGTITRTAVALSWTNGAGAIQTGVSIQRATNSTFTAGLKTTNVNGAAVTSRNVTGLKRNTTYWFRVAGRNAQGTGGWSVPIQATTLP